VKYHRKPGTSWLRFTPAHYYCRNCGVEIRPALLPLGHIAWLLMLGLLLVAVLATFSPLSWGIFHRYGFLGFPIWALLTFPLSLIIVFWGTRFRLAGGAHNPSALSNNRWRGP